MSKELSHVLIIDDDERLSRLLKQFLTENGFLVSVTFNAPEADMAQQLMSFDALIVDGMMPFKNGLDYVKELREKGVETPILILTAMNEVENRILGLENGANDYLAKPFEPKELLLRLHNILKMNKKKQNIPLLGGFVFAPQNGILKKGGETIALTSAEVQLLMCLAKNISTVVSREELGNLLQTDNLRSVDVQVMRLRKKMLGENQNQSCIQTVRGKGYVLVGE